MLATILLAPVPGLQAAPGFIESTQIRQGSVFAEVLVRLRCRVQYLGHDPAGESDILRVRLEPTSVCTGAPPSIAQSRQLYRPPGADDALLDSIEYEGETSGAEFLRFNFTADVRVDVRPGPDGDSVVLRVFSPERAAANVERRVSRRVRHEEPATADYVINLESSRRRPATADMPAVTLAAGQELFVSEVEIDGSNWYRTRVGYFDSAASAARALRQFRQQFPDAWVDRKAPGDASVALLPVSARGSEPAPSENSVAPSAGDELDSLMADARRAMISGELSRAIQIYTKVLQPPANPLQRDAQEFLALARERNGQVAHAKAEYERYLAVYPDGDGADRVRQRLAALLAAPRTAAAATDPAVAAAGRPERRRDPSNWNVRTFWSQHYRRDVNQLNDQDEVVSQSSIYSDASLDMRRRGERFDFSARVTAGYRSDLLDEQRNTGNDLRVSYAYADLADSGTGLRGRLGRQTRNTGGVLGRFDGVNLGWDIGERTGVEAVLGRPVFSTARDDELDRTFYGLSANFEPFAEGFDVGVFYLAQEFDGLTDREAVGGELRYFGETRTLWGMVEYNPVFEEIGSAFLQTSWRFGGDFTITGLFDHRYSPYVMLGNALIGQPSQNFDDLLLTYSEDELRQIALDRSSPTTTMTLGLSKALTPRLQLGFNASRSKMDGTATSAGVDAIPESEYSYYSMDLVASSIIGQGDVSIFSVRQSTTSTTEILSFTVDSRFPIGRSWRISPRLRVDRRQILSDQSEEMIYMPALRIMYRMGQRARLEFDAGRQFATRDMVVLDDIDRESYYVNIGYQLFF